MRSQRESRAEVGNVQGHKRNVDKHAYVLIGEGLVYPRPPRTSSGVCTSAAENLVGTIPGATQLTRTP